MLAFLRLEKIEFGGVRGQALSELVEHMYEEFTELTSAFQGRGDDPLDITNNVCTLELFFICRSNKIKM